MAHEQQLNGDVHRPSTHDMMFQQEASMYAEATLF